MQSKRLFVVDAMALAFRSYHAIARPLTTSSGMPTQAIYGSLMFLFNLIEKEKPDYLVIATDSAEKTFRHDMYDGYKANRSEMPEDLAVQIPHLYRAFEALGCHVLKQPGMEADDLIGSLVKQWANDQLHCYIVSGDKDFLQLVNANVSLYSPKKGGNVLITDPDGVVEKFGVPADHVIDILALMGDTADNVPGVPGIGEKGAAKLIQSFGCLEKIYESIDDISNKRQKDGLLNNKEKAFLSRDLVTIKTDIDLPIDLASTHCKPMEAIGNENLATLTEELEFKTLNQRVRDRIGQLVSEDSETTADNLGAQSVLNYSIVNTKEALKELEQKLKQAELMCFDSETTGLDVISDTPIGVSLSVEKDEAYYIPLVSEHQSGLNNDEIKSALQDVFSRKDLLKVGHNLKFDIQMLSNFGLNIEEPLADTMVASHLLDSTERSHSLDNCCLRYLNYEKIPSKDLLGDSGTMLDAPIDKLTQYACEDADYTLKLFHVLSPKLKEQGLWEVFTSIEMPLVPVIAHMEQSGIYLNTDHLESLSKRLDIRSKELAEKIHDLAGEEFNIKSPKQLQQILFTKLKIHEELGVKRLKKTKTGYSTDNSVLEKLKDHPLVEALLEYRQVTKIKSTYVDTLPQLVNPKTHRIHTSFHQTGTATGRLSSSDPNLQNVPIRTDLGKQIREAFCAQSNKTAIVAADYSQIELRLLAALSGDENLKTAFTQGHDIHTATAARILGIPESEVNPDQRSQAKAINFGIIYGMGPNRLARETGVSTSEAKAFIEKYFASYPAINAYIASAYDFAKEHGYTKTICGRKRPMPDINSTNPMVAANAKNIAVNSPVQGSAADLIKIAMTRVQNQLNQTSLNAKMLLQVHDELVFECSIPDLEEAKALIKDAMESAMDLGVPLKVDIRHGHTWLEAH